MRFLIPIYFFIARCAFAILRPVPAALDSFRKNLPQPSKTNIAFHAASAGELEILVPLIMAAIAKGKRPIVTAFSPSAISSLQKLPQECLIALSPSEEKWSEFFQRFSIQQIFVSKYEAWPGLWIACEKQKVLLTIINAQDRSSLRFIVSFLKRVGSPLPLLQIQLSFC